jgi:hypothetical protein
MNPNKNHIKALQKALCPGTPFQKIKEPMVRGGRAIFDEIYVSTVFDSP